MKKRLWALSEAVLPHKHVFDFNQALMDFGATHCSARQAEVPGVSDEGLLQECRAADLTIRLD